MICSYKIYLMKLFSLSCYIVPRKNLPPLLLTLTERAPECLHYIGVSYGLTLPLLKFWKRAGFIPVYMRYVKVLNQIKNEAFTVIVTF